jgi:three-Cys-motif partner protein
MMMTTDSFFDESTEQSAVKTAIVSKYFWAWAKVVIPSAKRLGGRIAYLDLFAGPGRYKDGTQSTPLLILEQAIRDPDMPEMLVTIFNDKDERQVRDLERAINELPGVKTFKHPPQVWNQEVGTEMVKMFESMHLVPTLFFVDPWGYKGLSLQIVNSVLKDWGCDCIFFFNFNRINMGLGNPYVVEHMNALFGEERAGQLRQKLSPLAPAERELTIVEELCSALGAQSGRFVLPFRFRDDRGSRTSHHLIFVSKHFRGYEIMKEIMAKESSTHDQGVPSFEYNPADKQFPLLFELSRPLDDLEDMLLRAFAGQALAMNDIYQQHSVGTPYIRRNYKDALISLERKRRIKADPPAGERRAGTFADHVRAIFRRSGGR